ncbi:MAG TPA: translation initiation factor IF-2 [Anaeromyxobacteraceae bacterium]|nr:translation initiation factor IF-2 [Anaeromyxobacteraceae bacterium]
MIKKRRGSAKGAIGQQRAETKRNAPGKRFIGEDAGAAEAKQAERAKVIQMQAAARAAAARAREEEDLRQERSSKLRIAGRLVRDTTRLAGTVARLPLRIASAAVSVPLRFVSAVWLHPREA